MRAGGDAGPSDVSSGPVRAPGRFGVGGILDGCPATPDRL
jgi:hypothetical protein